MHLLILRSTRVSGGAIGRHKPRLGKLVTSDNRMMCAEKTGVKGYSRKIRIPGWTAVFISFHHRPFRKYGNLGSPKSPDFCYEVAQNGFTNDCTSSKNKSHE